MKKIILTTALAIFSQLVFSQAVKTIKAVFNGFDEDVYVFEDDEDVYYFHEVSDVLRVKFKLKTIIYNGETFEVTYTTTDLEGEDPTLTITGLKIIKELDEEEIEEEEED